MGDIDDGGTIFLLLSIYYQKAFLMVDGNRYQYHSAGG